MSELDEATKKVKETIQGIREEVRTVGDSMRREKGVLANMRKRRKKRQERRKSRRKE